MIDLAEVLAQVPEQSAEGEAAPAAEEAPAEATETEATEESAEEEAEAETEETPEPEPDADPFSDAALSTPEGVKAAAEKLREQARAARQHEHRVEKKAAKLARRVREFAQERDTVLTMRRTIEEATSNLKRGGAKEILHALGTITGREPVKVLEELNYLIASNGRHKPAEDDPVKAEIAQLKREMAEREERAKADALAREVADAKRQIGELVESESYPSAAKWIGGDRARRAEAVEWIADLITTNYAAGVSVSWQDACAELEARFAALSPAPAADTKPSKAKATSLGTRAQSAPVKHRARTEAETIEDLAADPNFLAALGLA